MSQKMPLPLMTEGGTVASTRLCPVCGEASYSRQGIHPQCAVTQADATRTARLKAAAKKREKSPAHKATNSFTLSAWHRRTARGAAARSTSAKSPALAATPSTSGSSRPPHRGSLRNRSALPITETELKLIAALAIIGLSSSPNTG